MAGGGKVLALNLYHDARESRNGVKKVLFIARHPLLETAHRMAWPQTAADARQIESLKAQLATATLELDKTMKRFRLTAAALAHTAHDMNNPLTAVFGTSEYLRATIEDGTLLAKGGLSEVTALLDLIRTTTGFMKGVISSAYEVIDAETGCITPKNEVVNLADEAIQMVKMHTAIAMEKGIGLVLLPCGPAYACIDKGLFARALENLIGNAIKFTSTGSVLVSVERANGNVSVSVKDTGNGIPADQLQRIFEEHARAPGNQHYEGRGLGLYIVKVFAELMHGTVSVQSEVGKGSTFTISFQEVQGHVEHEEKELKEVHA